MPVPPRLRRPRVREAAQCQLCGPGHLLAVHGPAELAPGQHHAAGACPGGPVTKGSRAGQSSKSLPAWETWEEPVLIKTLWMWGQQMWKGYWVTKAIFDRGKREGWKWSRVTGSCPTTCLACPPEPACRTAHTPRAWDMAGAGSGLQLWPRIFSLLAPGPLFIHLTSGISSLNSGRGGQKARPT